MGSYKKKLSIVLLLFLLINFCVCSSVNATSIYQDESTYTIDTNILLCQQQEILANMFLTRLELNKDVNAYRFFNEKIRDPNFFCYFTYIDNPLQTNVYGYSIGCYFIPVKIRWSNLSNLDFYDSKDLYDDSYFLIPTSGYLFTASDINESYINRCRVNLGVVNTAFDNVTESVFLPSLLIYYNNETLTNYINGIIPTSSPWSMLISAMNANTEAVEDTTQAVNNLRNDFNEEENDSDYSYPTNNPTQDITESSIDSIFNLFYNKIDAWSDALMRIPIPFTGKHFDIPSNLTENILNSFPAGNVIGRLLGLIWYYLLGVYIIKDVQKYIDGLQTGEILTKSDTNIKTEML